LVTRLEEWHVVGIYEILLKILGSPWMWHTLKHNAF
jgi:hypothetical protein